MNPRSVSDTQETPEPIWTPTSSQWTHRKIPDETLKTQTKSNQQDLQLLLNTESVSLFFVYVLPSMRKGTSLLEIVLQSELQKMRFMSTHRLGTDMDLNLHIPTQVPATLSLPNLLPFKRFFFLYIHGHERLIKNVL